MALDISGYSTTFKVFTDFAADNIAEKGEKPVVTDIKISQSFSENV